ncbi:MAG: VOC family protein [Leptolyngbya sp. SIO4C1]|nr:VOC family protein [Leptolyngbya sp. SIO4C1]
MDVQAASTRLLVSDIKTCCEFYRDLLGLPVVIEDLERGYVEFEIANMRLSLFSQQEMAEIIHTTDKPSQADCQDKVLLIFKVRNVDDVYHNLHLKGIKFDEPPTKNADFALKIAYCRDPENNLIGLFEPLM